MYVKKTGGSVRVFLSSDGQSIPFGTNWVHEVEQALSACKLMFVFVTPTSIRSAWMYFESGHAYAKGVRVIPIGFLGMDLADIEPPLSLLQGFNINSASALNNLIAETNGEFSHSHKEAFTSEDLDSITASAGALSTTLGSYAAAIDHIQVYLESKPASALMPRLEEEARRLGINLSRSGNVINLEGLTLEERASSVVVCSMDPAVTDVVLPRLELLVRAAVGSCENVPFAIHFGQGVHSEAREHRITGHLFGTETAIVEQSDSGLVMSFRSIRFQFQRSFMRPGEEIPPRLVTWPLEDRFPVADVRDLLRILFEREVLFFGA